MNNVESKGVTFFRYIFWLLFAAMTTFLREAAVSKSGLNIFLAIFFAIFGITTSRIMSHRYGREQIILKESRIYFRDTVAQKFGLIIIMAILIGVTRIGVTYLQLKGVLPKFNNDYYASSDQKVLIFNMLANIFIISFQQMMVSQVFLYNYFWRRNTTSNYVSGMVMSGIVLAVISLTTTYQEFILYFLLGIVYTIIYRKTKDFKVTLLLIIFSNIMGTLIV
ncbi:CPBP family glutamic-type intramembrane protease [Companilactobacillus sp. DQM5]|uniref:CPBP family glutamic-type intramembrane protease n=1 Tax=Companilactobacillus sp. DQM5 TaxID=3463359 RepID=UPI004058A4DA